MSDDDRFKLGNLAFFERELWNSTLAGEWVYQRLHNYHFSTTLSLYPFELARWLHIGSRIGFFDSLQAATFLSHQDSALQKSWDVLLKHGGSPLPELPAFIINDRSLLKTNIKAFLEGISESNSHGQGLFQTHFLMNSELMGDSDAIFFLEALNWAPEEVWSSIINRELWLGSLAALARGLSVVFTFLEANEFAFANILDSPEVKISPDTFLLHKELRDLQRARLGLEQVYTAKRYFQLAGTLMADSTIATTQEELDPSRVAFGQIESLLGWWINLAPSDKEACWDAFSTELERSANRQLGRRRFNV